MREITTPLDIIQLTFAIIGIIFVIAGGTFRFSKKQTELETKLMYIGILFNAVSITIAFFN